MTFFHNRRPLWSSSDPGYSVRFGVNVSRWAISFYWMAGVHENWVGLGWW